MKVSKSSPGEIVVAAFTLAASAAAGAAALSAVLATPNVPHTWRPGDPPVDLSAFINQEITAEGLYLVAFVACLIVRRWQGASTSRVWFDWWFVATSLPLLRFLPWGALVVIPANVTLFLTRRPRRSCPEPG